MPIEVCEIDGRPGFRWGQSGKCYIYTAHDEDSRMVAYSQAARQGVAARMAGYEEPKMNSSDTTPSREAVEDPTIEQRRDLPAPAFEPVAYFEDDVFLRSRSKLPHHVNTVKDADENASVDVPRLRNALARFNQTDFSGFPDGTKQRSRVHLERHADAILYKSDEGGCQNCNREEIDGLRLALNSLRASGTR